MQKIKTWLEDRSITEVEGLVPDMSGTARGKIVPARKFCRDDGMRLPESLFVQTVTGEYPDPFPIAAAERDMVLRPDESTIRIVPWALEPTALVIHDCFHHDETPVSIAPRYVLQRMLETYRQAGWNPLIAPEVEFFLVKRNTDPDYPLEPPIGRSGRQETVRQSYSIDAVNEFDPLFEEMYEFAEAQGLDIDTLIHESGAAQMEVNFVHGDALDLADQVFLFKRTLREVAVRHEIYATFMAKPMAREPGSAMHIHQNVLDLKTGENVFSDASGSETALFRGHVAGLQKYIPHAMLLFAPYVNSYRRVTRYFAAPVNTHWAYDNRTVGLRIPVSKPGSRRVENRIAGADVNPYLAIAASLACGYLGMVEGLEPSAPIDGDAYDDDISLPRNMDASVKNLKEFDALKKLLGEKFIEVYCAVKEREYETFFQVISAWEREFLLLSV